METWLSRERKRVEAYRSGKAALNKLNSIKARLRTARSEVYCTLQVGLMPARLSLAVHMASAVLHLQPCHS